MADVPPTVKGMNDILPPEVSKWQFVEEKARGVLEAFAYREVRTPVLEYTPLFVRSVGEVTDVVEKQMYTFDDRDGRSVSMRPEGTAPAVRAYIEHAQWTREPVTRWYYLGPMFRHERAQRGRLRQFHQVGAEVLRRRRADRRRRDDRACWRRCSSTSASRPPSSRCTLNSLGEPEERAGLSRRAAWRISRRTPRQARRGLDSGASRPTRCASSTRRAPTCRRSSPARRCCSTASATRRERASTRVRELLARSASPTRSTRAWCAASTTTRGTIFEIKANVGELGAQNTVVRRRALRSAWSSRSAGPRAPALGFGLGHRADAAGARRAGRELRAGRSASSSRRWTRPPSPSPCRSRTGCARPACASRSSTARPA